MSRPALFLDRDGVINVDHGYVCKPEYFEFIDGIFELVSAANAAGYLVIVITNQAGIGRGHYSEQEFHRLTDWMKAQFALRGARIDAVYFCPFHPEHGVGEYRRESDCRKPGPGMVLQAQKEHDVDLGRSILVGDKPSDMQAGRTAGVGSLLYLGETNVAEGAIPITRLDQALRCFAAH
jgi:D-glycero-D-manno-heptose 1,7-bisphosphate phosphatase